MRLVHRVAHHHFERLHRNVDGRVEKHQREKSKPHGGIQAQKQTLFEREIAGIGQQHHHRHGNHGTNNQIEFTSAKHGAKPCFVGQQSHQWLHYHAHERRQYPEITQIVRVGTKRGKNATDVGALQRIGNLHAKKSETEVPQLQKT